MLLALPLAATGAARGASLPAQPAKGTAAKAVMKILSLVGDPRHPTTVYIGGSAADPDFYDHGFYGYWRSTDAGATWSDLGRALGLGQTFTGHEDPTDPTSDPLYGQTSISTFSIAPDDSYLLASLYHQTWTPGTAYSKLIRSADGGLTWTMLSGDQGQYGSGQTLPVISPVSPQRAYRLDGNSDVDTLETSGDGGKTWSSSDATSLVGAIIADPARASTVYTGHGDRDAVYSGIGLQWLRSDDAGATWSGVITPTDALALSDFSLGTDSNLPGLLVARTTTDGIPADRRYLSGDEGRTWRIASCPGDLAGSCPRYTVKNVFGAGASYGFYADGIRPFQGAGRAGTRLALSAGLPVPTAHLASVFAGAHAGDPIFLLSDDTAGAHADTLYRSTDAGRTWRQLATDLPPNLAAPSTAPGTLLVRTTHHSVAAPFVALYRKLGLRIIGYPVTEAYLQDDVTTQDFEHLRLQRRGGKVVVAPFGLDVYHYGSTSGEPDPTSSVLAPTDLPIAAAPDGQFAAFWRAHGGLAIFGAPITQEFDSDNGDGSGRTYTMQYFQNARLEAHPESKDPAYRISLGLLGQESLYARGWTGPQS